MLKRSLLSLSVAAIMVSTSGCKISSVEDNNVVDLTSVEAGSGTESNPAVYPKFAPLNSVAVVQFGSDFIFSSAATSDGTAETGLAGTSAANAITGAIDDLDGWSTTAAIDIPFNASIDPDSISTSVLTQNVFLIKLAGGGNNQVDALDFAQIGALGSGAVASPNLTGGVDYTAAVISIDGGTNNVLRIYPKKPLEARTKYIVALTNGIKDSNGNAVKAAAQYSDLVSNAPLISDNVKLPSIRALLQGMEAMVKGYFAAVDTATSGATSYSDDGIVFTAPITTTDPTYALRVNAAPGIFMEDELAKYKTDIQTDSGATDVAADMALAKKLMDATAFNASVSAYYEEALLATVAAGFSPAMPVTTDAEKDAVRATDEYKEAVRAKFDDAGFYATAKAVFKEAVDPSSGPSATDKPASRDFGMIPVSGSIGLSGDNFGLSSTTMISQGYITLPQYTEKLSVDANSIWRASASVGSVFDSAFQAAAGTYPPKDVDDSTNVTYRFPFVAEVRDAVVPVLVTTPTSGSCTKGSGWPVAIFMHGITVDRAATLGVADQLATNCIAMVAIDQPQHGIAPLASDRNGASILNSRLIFSVDHLNTASASLSPWAAAIAADPSGLGALGIAERHEGLYLNGTSAAPMAYDDAKIAAAMTAKAAVTDDTSAATAAAAFADIGTAAGKSGDYFVRLDNFQRTRDNIRQSVMDLLNVAATLGAMNVDASAGADFDTDKVYFIGHSLGAIVGTTFVSVINDAQVQSNNPILPTIQAAVLANPGSQLSKLLENSVSFSQALIPGLAAQGLTQGSSNLEKFYQAIQAHVDQADPISYASAIPATTPVLLFEMVGGGSMTGKFDNPLTATVTETCSLSTTLCSALTNFPADLVVPNRANGDHELVSLGSTRVETAVSYMAGTDPLIDQLGLTQYNSAQSGSDPLKAVVKFDSGTHGTFASGDVPLTFADMMTQTISFLASNGRILSMTGSGGVVAP